MGYHMNPCFADPDPASLERLSRKAAELRWKQEIAWAEEWAASGQAPIHVILEPAGKSYLLESHGSWPCTWLVDGCGAADRAE